MTPFFRSYKGKSKSMYYNKHSETFIECCLVRYSEKRFFENVCLTFPHTVCDILCSLDYDHSRPFGGISSVTVFGLTICISRYAWNLFNGWSFYPSATRYLGYFHTLGAHIWYCITKSAVGRVRNPRLSTSIWTTLFSGSRLGLDWSPVIFI